jgi:GNAT superfamily N-acetyltransferase
MRWTLDRIERPAVEQRLDVRIVDATNPDLMTLVDALDAELEERYPHHLMVGLPSTPGGLFLAVAYLDGAPVGCGALRELESGVGEVKRMFVLPAARGLGIARRLLGVLETEAQDRDYSFLRLETGVRQPEALALYESCGFHRIPAFGEYVESELGVCFEKQLR